MNGLIKIFGPQITQLEDHSRLNAFHGRRILSCCFSSFLPDLRPLHGNKSSFKLAIDHRFFMLFPCNTHGMEILFSWQPLEKVFFDFASLCLTVCNLWVFWWIYDYSEQQVFCDKYWYGQIYECLFLDLPFPGNKNSSFAERIEIVCQKLLHFYSKKFFQICFYLYRIIFLWFWFFHEQKTYQLTWISWTSLTSFESGRSLFFHFLLVRSEYIFLGKARSNGFIRRRTIPAIDIAVIVWWINREINQKYQWKTSRYAYFHNLMIIDVSD